VGQRNAGQVEKADGGGGRGRTHCSRQKARPRVDDGRSKWSLGHFLERIWSSCKLSHGKGSELPVNTVICMHEGFSCLKGHVVPCRTYAEAGDRKLPQRKDV